MITRLTGIAEKINDTTAVVDVNGVGYKVLVSTDTSTLIETTNKEPITLWTYLVVRETALELFGFESQSDLAFFELLISVSGIGPRTALSITGIAPTTTLKTAIAQRDTSYLTQVSGIGKKNAEKIILELHDKLDKIYSEENDSLRGDTDTLEALRALGYTTETAREALKSIDSKITGTSNKVREALKILGS